MAYGTVAGVLARIPGLRANAISTPDTDQIGVWLAQGAACIDRKLGAGGYGVPVGISAAVYPELVALNEVYAAAHALRARGLDTVTGTGETRSEIWLREFNAQLADLAQADLTGSGVLQVTVTGVRPQRIRSLQLRRIDGYSRRAYPAEPAE